jgi:uncharacterized protein YjlB
MQLGNSNDANHYHHHYHHQMNAVLGALKNSKVITGGRSAVIHLVV